MDTLFAIEAETEFGKLGQTKYVLNTDYDERKGRARRDDPKTSHEGAEAVAYRAGSHKAKLIEVFSRYPEGLTDEEAASHANLLRAGYWKRCGELREDGLIEPTGDTRVGEAGVSRMVCRITAKGYEVAKSVSV